jgi:hypothetical protein
MKLQASSFIAVSLLSLAAIACQDHATHWKIYRNGEYGFEVKYPETWAVQGEGSGTGQRTKVWMVNLVKPHRDGEPDTYLSLSVMENANPSELSIDDFVARQMTGIQGKPESSGHVTIGGQPAIFMEVRTSLGTTERLTYTFLHGTDLLCLTSRNQEQFDPTFNAIFSSFRVVR